VAIRPIVRTLTRQLGNWLTCQQVNLLTLQLKYLNCYILFYKSAPNFTPF